MTGVQTCLFRSEPVAVVRTMVRLAGWQVVVVEGQLMIRLRQWEGKGDEVRVRVRGGRGGRVGWRGRVRVRVGARAAGVRCRRRREGYPSLVLVLILILRHRDGRRRVSSCRRLPPPLPKQTSHTRSTHRFLLPCSPSCLLLLQSALRLLPPLQLFLILSPQPPPPGPESPQPDQERKREAEKGREDGG